MSELSMFVWAHLDRIVTYVVEVLVLIFIFRELRLLKRHSAALARHEGKLEQVRPLLSILYTASDEILQLAIDFTREARYIYAVGTVSVLAQTEVQVREDENQWRSRVERVSPLRREYAAATLDFIHSGRPYCRVMNFSPSAATEQDLLLELRANVRFFLRAMEDQGTKLLNIQLYHNPDLAIGREDFHYRVSDSTVVIRVGGPTHAITNAAIAIKDTKVVETFAAAHKALQEGQGCRKINLAMLRSIDECLATRDTDGLERLLDEEVK